jgi:hypothetical protein
MGAYAQVICKYYAILYKGLGHPRILAWGDRSGIIPHRYEIQFSSI